LSRALLITVIILSLIGLADSGYAIHQHYAPAGESACNVSATVNCDTVNQSEYSELFGIPVAAIGAAGYLIFIALSAMLLYGFRFNGLTLLALLGSVLFGLAYSLYLTYVEIYVLGAVCPMCIISLTLLFAINAVVVAGYAREWRGRHGQD
jgi:uncharacterized membrane protein